jgi:PleD family two-component response regulator
MERADQALYTSKTAGKNRVTVATARAFVAAAG